MVGNLGILLIYEGVNAIFDRLTNRKKCLKCKNRLKNDMKFCPKCGKEIHDVDKNKK